MNKKHLIFLSLILTHITLAKEIQIQENHTTLTEQQIDTIAKISLGGGVKEPLKLHRTDEGVRVSGDGSAQCHIKLSSEGKPLGVNCKK